MFIITFLLASNFLGFTLSTNILLKNKIIEPVITFTLINAGMFALGWGLSYLIKPTLGSFDTMIFPVILFFVGVKILFRAFTVTDANRVNEIVHIVEAVGFAFAMGVNSMIIGLGLGFVSDYLFLSLGLIEVNTLVLSALGIVVRMKKGCALGGKPIEIISGVSFLVLGILSFFEIYF